MQKRRFEIELNGTALIELDQSVLDEVDDSFKKNIYNLDTLHKIVEHLAYNLIVNQLRLSDLDGWVDHPNSDARVYDEDWDITIKEVTHTQTGKACRIS